MGHNPCGVSQEGDRAQAVRIHRVYVCGGGWSYYETESQESEKSGGVSPERVALISIENVTVGECVTYAPTVKEARDRRPEVAARHLISPEVGVPGCRMFVYIAHIVRRYTPGVDRLARAAVHAGTSA
jgi:hypothetical protein